MLSQLRTALVMLGLLTALTGVFYPLAVTGVAALCFPGKSAGSLVVRDRVVVGSALIGQDFSSPRYFHGRPSATSPAACNAASSVGSNLGPINPALIEAAESRATAWRAAAPASSGPVPVDLLTTSGSGLDPHISPAAAQWQVAAVAKARGIAPERVATLVASLTEGRTLGILGEPRVNVLLLNLALDDLH